MPEASAERGASAYPLTPEARELELPKVNGFQWSETDEPHASRRRLILAKYPQIRQLFTKEPRTFVVVVGVIIFQLLMARWAQSASWGWLLLAAYVIGGTVNHTMAMAVHELSHNLCWEEEVYNKLTGILANLPTGLPSSILFQKYHMEHHQFQGVDGWDGDVPLNWEGKFFRSPLRKAIWVLCQPLLYTIRPMCGRPKQPGAWEVLNFVCVFAFNAVVVYTIGVRGLAYLVIGTLLGFGLHPASGHLIAEHYIMHPGQETYSYYGPMNWFNFNVGYHNEHHDFPRIPWSNLPKVRAIAGEFYKDLKHHTSYTSVFARYIFDSRISPFSRMKRRAPAPRVYKTPADKTTDTSDILSTEQAPARPAPALPPAHT